MKQARALRNAKLQHAKTEYLNNNGRFSNTNSELLQFAVTQGGTYTVVVTRMDSGASITHDVAISWY